MSCSKSSLFATFVAFTFMLYFLTSTWISLVHEYHLGIDSIKRKTDNNHTSEEYCLATEFIKQFIDTHKPLTSSLLDNLKGCRNVLYLRTPKCGSRGVRVVFEVLGQRYGYVTPTLRASDPVESLMEESNSPLVVTSHHVYTDFSSLSPHEPVLINVIRDPIDHLVSVFSWRKYGSRVSDIKRNHRKRKTNLTLEICLEKYGLREPCFNDGFTAVRYFCGSGNACRNRTSWRLQQALTHLSSRYMVVGITEQMEDFWKLLENLLPGLFYNATEVYHDRLAASLSNWSSIQHEEISPRTRDQLKKEFADDYHLYLFAKARLATQLDKLRAYNQQKRYIREIGSINGIE